MLVVIQKIVSRINRVKIRLVTIDAIIISQRLSQKHGVGNLGAVSGAALVIVSALSPLAHAQDHRLYGVQHTQAVSTNTLGRLVRDPQGSEQTLFKPSAPQGMRATIVNNANVWQADPKLVTGQRPVRSTYDCAVDFNDENAINLFVGKAADTFAFFPFWNQVCNVDVSVNVRPFYINHFHLSYEKDVCIDDSTGNFGEMQEDETCMQFEDPAKEARRLSSMLPNDVVELTAYNNYYDTRIDFDLKRIRVVGNRPVRVCYKPAEQNDGDWITTEVDDASGTGTWLCWNNLSTGYWDLSDWAGDVSAVRIVVADGQPNFSVDDILINAPPY